MEQGDSGSPVIFVLRLMRDRAGGISAVLERVRTGEKLRIAGLDGVAAALAAMLDGDPRER